ncbi:hypothetical protein GCM10027565_06900 [Bordetella tumulicola]
MTQSAEDIADERWPWTVYRAKTCEYADLKQQAPVKTGACCLANQSRLRGLEEQGD